MKKYLFNLLVYGFIFTIFSLSSCTFKVGEGLISFDQTILLQFAIILIALYVLNSLIFKPLLGLLDRREQLTKGTVVEARELTEKAENLINDYKQKINDARAEATEKRAEIRKEAQLISEKMISEARDESHSTLESYKRDLDIQVTDIKAKIKPEIENLAKEISDKVLSMED
jgi:F-type H+-transporting ATPase subunit b